MRTPIADFLCSYASSGISRFHMPGHKGNSFLGIESHDITEVAGADVLDSADGIIAESEKNAAELFGSAMTVYSTEGSTLAIRTMLFLVAGAGAQGERPLIIAARNAHKSFINSSALLDFDVDWIFPEGDYSSVSSLDITPKMVIDAVKKADRRPTAVYLTSPDYMGKLADIKGIADALLPYGIPLLVDNAHGAYLRFLDESMHPINLGAYMCADSAHKTLPVLTGGAYLHLSSAARLAYGERVKAAASLFASTSPSYLILESLDLCNRYLVDLKAKLSDTVKKAQDIRKLAKDKGIGVLDSEPLKIVFDCTAIGYTGYEMAEIMRQIGIEPEYSDPDFLVLMVGAENSDADFHRLTEFIDRISPRAPIAKTDLSALKSLNSVMSAREAVFSPSVRVAADRCAVGRIVAAPTVSCPPAIPIVSAGERITEDAIALFRKYGIDTVLVVKE